MNVIASSEGSLYELMCRGKKDTYFYEDSRKSVVPFDVSYKHEEQIIREIRRIPPTTGTDFGKTIEFPIDIVGDILDSLTFLIHLPSWYPAPVARLVPNIQVTDTAGIYHGYVNGIAYFLFEKIQFYQDNIILQEFSGDYLWCSSQVQGTYANTFIEKEETGSHDGSPMSIGNNAVPGPLRLKIPLVGCSPGDRGFPLVSINSHVYKIKCKLRKIEDLVEVSDITQGKGSPWDKPMQYTNLSGITPFTALSKNQMEPLRVQLETQHVFLNNESKDELRKTPIEIPFKSVYENISTQTPQESTSVAINRRIDACHPSSRIVWMFRLLTDIHANRLWKVMPYLTMGLTIAGRSRETNFSPSIWRDVTNYAKEDIDSGTEINTMNWGLGCVSPQKYGISQTDGTINFTTADRPTLYMSLQPSDATELRVCVEGWGSFLTDGKGRAEVLSFN